MKTILITGTGGLIGGEAARHFLEKGWEVHGIDNNTRMWLFGKEADVSGGIASLSESESYTHHHVDIRDRSRISSIHCQVRPNAVIHCAAQPSHDKAADIPFDDFDINALGTVNLLEAFRLYAPADASFVYVSTNKVYGDGPNRLELNEEDTRWEPNMYPDIGEDVPVGLWFDGINEDFPIDQCLHSLFGASKLSADIMAQEYGRYFNLNVGIFRGGCLTGPTHAGVELHGFLSYIVKCAMSEKPYSIFGYSGKQVRDQIHSKDVITAFEAFIENPRQGEVYNIGGERRNSASILEIINLIEEISGKRLQYTLSDEARKGDHIWYISDMTKFRSHYPDWEPQFDLRDMISEMVAAHRESA
ncbi:NAD-dependent epimerase/dehydratase family protein [Candidatus Bathyarchaeota archaeon]|jgi:CDP-paratose 2-epimerase|nr:NAD-dependent epimerase/dehydratase family protein [Candidatus Bathyarchaeota archaeon]